MSPGALILTLCGYDEKDPGRSPRETGTVRNASGTRCGAKDATEAEMGEAQPGVMLSPPPRSDHLDYQDSGDWE